MTSAARHEPEPGPAVGPVPCPELLEAWLGGSVHADALRGVDAAADPALKPADAAHFRDVLGRFASGITVVTAIRDGEPVGLTCQSFSSVSLEPPLVLFAVAGTSRSWPAIRAAGRFCVNLLAADQAWVSNAMASRGADKFADVDWTPSQVTGSPRLAGTLGHVDCTVHAVHPAGDHDVVIGRVVDLAAGQAGEADPLLFYRGRYRTTG